MAKILIKNVVYPSKVLLAWAESIKGNQEIYNWLISNKYTELAMFSTAAHNDPICRQWLMDNGFPHLMAVINGAEGNEAAVKWLIENNFEALSHVARAADGKLRDFQWLKNRSQFELANVAKALKEVKDSIEEKNNDPHFFK